MLRYPLDVSQAQNAHQSEAADEDAVDSDEVPVLHFASVN